jgi:hypothetical protein
VRTQGTPRDQPGVHPRALLEKLIVARSAKSPFVLQSGANVASNKQSKLTV